MRNKNNNFTIKRVIRANLPETNSSSSHSVVICRDPRFLIKREDLNKYLELRDDGVLYIKKRGEDFGWEWEKYNSPMQKIWYVCGILFGNYIENHKLRKIFKDLLKSYTGATDVIFEWEEERKKEDPNCLNDDYYFENAPQIDHNSSDIFPEIVESRESLRNFIFNSKSWLYLGNDNSDADDSFYDDQDEEKSPAIASLEFGGKIGRVDVELKKFPNINIIDEIIKDDVIQNLVYNTTKHEWEIERPSSRFTTLFDKNSDKSKLYISNDNLDKILKPKHIYWISTKLMEMLGKAGYSIWKDNIDKEKIINILKSNPDHWKAIPIKIITEEFGEI